MRKVIPATNAMAQKEIIVQANFSFQLFMAGL